MSSKMSPTGRTDADRRALLERYLGLWLASHALKVSDLARREILTSMLNTLSEDLGAILGDKVDLAAGYVGAQVAQYGSKLLRQGLSKLLTGKGS